MGVFACKSLYARHCDGAHRIYDPGTTASVLRTLCRRWICACLITCLFTAGCAWADILRIASYNVGLDRDGPGLLLRDILRGDDDQISALINVISWVSPDILVLQKFDYDHDLKALTAFSEVLEDAGTAYPYLFAGMPNAGMATGLDLDGDGCTGDASDAQGFGRFAGNGGMAVMSKLPLQTDDMRDFSDFLWKDLPGENQPDASDQFTPSDMARSVQRLSSVSHWELPAVLPDGNILYLWTMAAGPPVFDGPEDRNGRRNHDETAFWLRFMDGDLPFIPYGGNFILLGGFNLDPVDGGGRAGALHSLLSDPRVQDPSPSSIRGVKASADQGGINDSHLGDPALDTVDWPDVDGGPGNMRVDYILPSTDLNIVDSGVFWPEGGSGNEASTHRLIWVDIAF